MSDLPDVVKQKIEEVKQKKLKKLSLNSSISEFPIEILDFDFLEELHLENNHLRALPHEIGQLKNLKNLKLANNDLDKLPISITQLKNLSSLTLNGNKFRELPDWISMLENLIELELWGCHLVDLPIQISEMTKLTVLILGGNRFNFIPEMISHLPNLRYLDFIGNELTDLPDWLSNMGKLTTLQLSNNKFKQIPNIVCQIPFIQILHFYNLEKVTISGIDYKINNKNEIRLIPKEISNLVNLEQFIISNNPINHPPPEIVKNGFFYGERLKALLNFFKQLEQKGMDRLYEAKLLIVGEGGAGKTSLAKKIENTNYELQDEISTKGIEVIKWSFPMPNGQVFRVNIWDFGGQEIYHATHQFFLTKRSLYLLVTDSRKEDTDFDYWLNVVELLSDKSPLLIIKNEKQDRQRAINERQLLGQFESLQKALPTNLADNRGLDAILDEIKHYISHLPHVGAALPKTWVEVRKILESDPRDYINLNEYLDICENNGFKERKDKLQLSEYLHDLGVCLHFQDDPVLKNIIILKPQWGTDAAYRVLDNPTVIANFGRFSKHDLANIWYEDQYADMHHELLRLMMNFKLCYAIPNSELYIAPQLLNINQADYTWNETDNLYMRYAYPDFMPKGIVTRFIVELHGIIADNRQMVWRNGVVLENEEAKAEVVEFYGRREIQIRVVGKNRKSLRKIVAIELDRINEAYYGLKYVKLIPCNCGTCVNSTAPHFFPYEVLRNALHYHQSEIQCFKSYEMVNIDHLLDDIGDDTASGRGNTQSLQ